MNEDFKKKLITLYDSDIYGSFGMHKRQEELKKIIRYGAIGELGENYFFFLYRDYYRDSAYYGSVIFLNKRDELDNPVTITGIEQNGKEQVRNVYVQAAIFFLKNKFQDTMAVAGSGNMKVVFDLARNKINTYIGKSAPAPDLLEDFDFHIAGQEVEVREIKPGKVTRKIHSRLLENNLRKLKKKPSSYKPEKQEEAGSKAKLGLNLKSQIPDLTGDKYNYFQPVIVPIRENLTAGKPQKVTAAQMNRYELDEPAEILADFLDHYLYLESQAGNPSFKINVMNRLYFEKLAEELLLMPDELTLCQPDNYGKEYKPLKKFKFKTLHVRFAPSLRKDSVMRFFLTFTGQDSRVLEARDDYRITLLAPKVYVSFTTPGEETWFAVPEEHEHFYGFFDFLNAQEECYVYDFDKVFAALRKYPSKYLSVQQKPLKKYEFHLLPVPVLNIFPRDAVQDKDERLELEFDYKQVIKEYLSQHPDKEVYTYTRDEDFENRCLSIMKHDPLLTQQMDFHTGKKSVYHYYYFKDKDFLTWLVERGRRYMEKGFKVYSVKWKRYIGNTGSSIQVNITHDIRWLEFKPLVQDPLSGKGYEIDLDAFDPEDNMVMDKKGMLHLVTREEIEKLVSLYRYAQPQGNVFLVPSGNFVLINRLYDKRMEEIPGLRDVLGTEERLEAFASIPDYPVSENFNGQLRGYQELGYRWLYFLRDYRFSGCLADDMGLGKTVQTLALLRALKDNNRLKTSLLVVPVSAIPNWESEIERFSPGLIHHRHIGAGRDGDAGGWGKIDLVITSYATLRNDIEWIKDFEFDYIVLDESQNIKNFSSQISKAVKILNGKNRLALSGTPIENNSMELWSLFDFLMPGFLGTYQWFGRQFARVIEKDEDTEKAELLKKMIYPFVMRRKKEEVEKDLPEKIEILSKIRMEDEQLTLYAETAAYYRGQIEKEIDEKGVAGSSIKILEAMLRLRQLCLFPQLMDDRYNDIPSAKFGHLKELLEEILAEKHKVLIFSQFVQALTIIKEHCDDQNVNYSYIDGSVNIKTREKMIKTFQEDEGTRVFLLSLKAGGVALNLTAADYVIIFDPWWNPAVEAQAIDRSHRIGQTKKVMVYRLVVEGSIEEKMLALQERKKALVENLIASDVRAFKNLKKEDILDLLGQRF